MPSLSGDTLVLPLACRFQTLACTAGNTAFCAASPDSGLNSAPRLVVYFFIAGLLAAAETATTDAAYFPLKNNGEPTTTRAGIAFPGNDWLTFTLGQEYLSRLGTPSTQLLDDLADLRQVHLDAVDDLVQAIRTGTLSQYLGLQFACPTVE